MARYRAFTLAFKLRIIKYLERNTISHTARKFKLDRKIVRNWSNNKDKILSQSSKHTRKRIMRHVVGRWPEFESQLYEWFKELRDQGNCVSSRMIQAQAIRTSPSLDFAASNGWLNNFLRRHRLVRRRLTSSGRDLPANAVDNWLYLRRGRSQ